MHKSSKTRWSGWSDWIWNSEHQRYYRERRDNNGNVDYQWDGESSYTASTAADEQTPRDTGVDGLAHTLENTHIQDPSSPASYDHQTSEYTIASGPSKQQKHKSSSKSKSKSSKSSSSKSKGKSPAGHDDDEAVERNNPHSSYSQQASSEEPYYDHETGQYYDYSQGSGQYTTDTSATYRGSTSASTSAAGHYDGMEYSQDEDPMIAAAIADSKRYNYTAHTAGESSSSAYGNAYEYDDEGPPTPRAGTSHTHISATEGEAEELDPRYRVELSHRFQPGEIFKVLWCEPQGSVSEGVPSVSDRQEVRDRFGGKIFVGFRRFIVIANDQGHCTCVPILTYGGKACNKRGVKPEKHGIVYERGHKARLLAGEPKLGFPSVKIQMTEDGEKLSKESRVNYSKLVTVEHNVKVLFIGRIVGSDWEIVSEAVNKCWEEKIHRKKKHFDR
ncbi:hypothetical protein BGZ63DRAFT_426831 [Mariannaea sp. PMI_226]|nr:hypothetical protein BGZ63DRAFT_426831 [Mariannaea sp. PMI_226]